VTTSFKPDRLEKSHAIRGFAHPRAGGDDDRAPNSFPALRWSDLFHW
jgi:hypothetical protein